MKKTFFNADLKKTFFTFITTKGASANDVLSS